MIPGQGASSPSAGTPGPVGGAETTPAPAAESPAPEVRTETSSDWGAEYEQFTASVAEPTSAPDTTAAPAPAEPATAAPVEAEQGQPAEPAPTPASPDGAFPDPASLDGPAPLRAAYKDVVDLARKFGTREQAEQRANFFQAWNDPDSVRSPAPLLQQLARENPHTFNAAVQELVTNPKNAPAIVEAITGRSLAEVQAALERLDGADAGEADDIDLEALDPASREMYEENQRLRAEQARTRERQEAEAAEATARARASRAEKVLGDLVSPLKAAADGVDLGEFNPLKDFLVAGAQDLYTDDAQGGEMMRKLAASVADGNEGGIAQFLPVVRTGTANKLATAIEMMGRLVKGYHRSLELERELVARTPPPVSGQVTPTTSAPARPPTVLNADGEDDWGKGFDAYLTGQAAR